MKGFRNLVYDIRNNKVLLLMLLPAVLFFFIFAYIPMGGIILAFKRLDYALGIFGSPWAGLENFKFFFISGQAFKVTRNTVFYNMVFIIIGTTSQISLAIFLSELGNKYFKKISQSLMLLPYFISWVVVSAIAYNLLNYEFGSLNTMLKSLGFEAIDVYGNVSAWKYILVFFNSWKYAGYGTVLYLAAIIGIDAEMYEAADIDGVNMIEKIWYITLPCLKPTMIILLLLSVGNIFRGDLNMFYQLVGNNGMLFDSTDVIDTFVFRSLLFTQEFGMSAAAGLYQSVLCFVVLTFTNYMVRRVDKDYALF